MKLPKSKLKLNATLAVAAILGAAAPAAATNIGYPFNWLPTGSGTPLVLPDTWIITYRDTFGAASIGPETSYGVNWFAPVHYQLGTGTLAQAGDPAIQVANGGLTLTTRKPNQPGGVDVNIQTTTSLGRGFSFQNGYIEARMKLPTAHGSHTGFWLLSQDVPKIGHGEVDIIEAYGQGDYKGHHHNVHWWPQPGSRFTSHIENSDYVVEMDLLTDWHTFGAMLDDNYVTIFYDRKQIAKIARLPEQKVPFHILVSCFTDPNRTDGYEPATLLVDYVKVWQAPS